MNGVIYARYSSDNQREESIEGQLRECRVFAQRNDIKNVGEYIDRAKSATTANRPEFQRMIDDSKSRGFEVVLVWKLDRFARNRYDSAHYKAQLRKNDIEEFEMFCERNLFTDDTVMTVAVAKAFIATLENPRSFKEENHQFLLQYAVRLLRRHSPR